MHALATWLPGPMNPMLPHGELHVWRIELENLSGEQRTAARDLLTSEERARADRFVVDAPRRRFEGARAALRILLARYTNVTPRELVFECGPHGKPFLAKSDIRFNLSHSENLALLAVMRDVEVGVDIEHIDERRAATDIAMRYFSPAEQALWSSCSPSEKNDAFFRIWSRKEAVIKALGEGLLCPLTSFDVALDDSSARLLDLRREGANVASWNMLSIDAHPDYAAAAAIIGPCRHAFGYSFNT